MLPPTAGATSSHLCHSMWAWGTKPSQGRFSLVFPYHKFHSTIFPHSSHSFRFIRPCDSASGVVWWHPCYSQTSITSLICNIWVNGLLFKSRTHCNIQITIITFQNIFHYFYWVSYFPLYSTIFREIIGGPSPPPIRDAHDILKLDMCSFSVAQEVRRSPPTEFASRSLHVGFVDETESG